MTIDELRFHNGLFAFYKEKPFTVRTAKEVHDEDWKTAMAHNIPPIPAETELVIKKTCINYYGIWLMAEYNGNLYYIDPMKCDFVGFEH